MESPVSDLPPVLFARALAYFLQGRLHLDREAVGSILREDEDYEVFRKIVLDAADRTPDSPGAVFRVTFSFTSMSIAANKKLSLIPIPFIVAQEGFRSKTWLIGTVTGRFMGLYEWDTVEAARNYWNSFPMKLMRRRAVPSSLLHTIHPAGSETPVPQRAAPES